MHSSPASPTSPLLSSPVLSPNPRELIVPLTIAEQNVLESQILDMLAQDPESSDTESPEEWLASAPGTPELSQSSLPSSGRNEIVPSSLQYASQEPITPQSGTWTYNAARGAYARLPTFIPFDHDAFAQEAHERLYRIQRHVEELDEQHEEHARITGEHDAA